MAGSVKNAAVWTEGDVYIGKPDATIPMGGAPFGPEWDLVGLLNGEDGFTESIETESSEHYAWGGVLVAVTNSKFKLTRQFTAFEDNETMFDLWYPGHDVTFGAEGEYEGDVNVPDLSTQFKIAFETRTGGILKRVVSRNYAQLTERGESQESETEIASRQATVTIFPGEMVNGKYPLLYTYKGPATAGGA